MLNEGMIGIYNHNGVQLPCVISEVIKDVGGNPTEFVKVETIPVDHDLSDSLDLKGVKVNIHMITRDKISSAFQPMYTYLKNCKN